MRYLLFAFHQYLQLPKVDQDHKYTSPVLEFHELIVDLLNVDLAPRDVVVGGDAIDDIIIEFVELLQEVELFADLRQLRELRAWEAEQLLTHGVT